MEIKKPACFEAAETPKEKKLWNRFKCMVFYYMFGLRDKLTAKVRK